MIAIVFILSLKKMHEVLNTSWALMFLRFLRAAVIKTEVKIQYNADRMRIL